MNDTPGGPTPATPEPAEEHKELELAEPSALPMPAPSRNYMAAIELGHVLAASGYYTDARDPAKAAVKVMIGMDLGLSPTAALQSIHAFEETGDGGTPRIVFLIEGKALAALVKARPGYDYRIVKRTELEVEIEFLREGQVLEPNIVWTMDDAKRANLASKRNWQRYPREMLTWRALVEGVRLHFPELMSGSPVYTDAEFGLEAEDLSLREALRGGPERPAPLADEEAEKLRAEINAAFEELREANPNRMARPLLENRIRGAEHSHEMLRNVARSIEELRDSERKVQGLAEELAAHMPPEVHAELIERGERLGSNAERIALYDRALSDRANELLAQEEAEALRAAEEEARHEQEVNE